MNELSAKHDLIFYENRSTPQVVPKGAPSKPKKGYGKVVKRRPASEEEEKVIRSGRWVRVDSKGRKPSDPKYKKTKYRPQLVSESAREFSPKMREQLAKKGFALPDGSYPIVNVEDLKNAIQAIGRAKNPAIAKRHIKKRAKALGKYDLIPESWK